MLTLAIHPGAAGLGTCLTIALKVHYRGDVACQLRAGRHWPAEHCYAPNLPHLAFKSSVDTAQH